MKHDVVYILKDGIEAGEINYSLRSVCKNFPYRKIVFYTGKPEGIEPDLYVPFRQKGMSPWDKTHSAIEHACNNPDISDDFWLFNDDFFIMKPVTKEVNYYDGTMKELIERNAFNGSYTSSLYAISMKLTRESLQGEGYKTINYATHTPMLINKEKGKELCRVYPKMTMFRPAYGNVWDIKGRQRKDCKIMDRGSHPFGKMEYLSTSDDAWEHGKAGEYIRKAFPDKCEYEV